MISEKFHLKISKKKKGSLKRTASTMDEWRQRPTVSILCILSLIKFPQDHQGFSHGNQSAQVCTVDRQQSKDSNPRRTNFKIQLFLPQKPTSSSSPSFKNPSAVFYDSAPFVFGNSVCDQYRCQFFLQYLQNVVSLGLIYIQVFHHEDCHSFS